MNAIKKLLTDHINTWTAAETEKKSGRGRASGSAASVYGIKKLRELILDLAMRGKLVQQDANDEPAGVLLENIALEKLQLVKDGKIKEQKPISPISAEEKQYDLAVGWEWVRLGQVAEIERGGSPRPIKSFLTDSPDGLNWIKIGDTDQGGKYITSANEKIHKDGLSKTRMVYPGDFLLTNSMSFGRPYITKIAGCIHDGWLRISPPSTIDKDYLYLLLSSPVVVAAFNAAAAGAVVLNLNADKVKELIIPVPPLAEQLRMVAKVDELMALCDQMETQHSNAADAHEQLVSHLLSTLTQSQSAVEFNANWQRIAAHFDTLFTTEASIDALKQTLLQLAVMGKLVAQEADDEPASELLKKIQAEKAKLIVEGKIKKGQPLAAITNKDQPFLLPPKWQWARFPDLGEFGRGKSKHRPRNDPILFNPEIYPLIQTGEVARAKNIITEYHSKYSNIGLAQSKMWPIGTLCITIAANIADSAILGFDACFPDSVVGFTPFKPLNDTKYFLAFMKTARQNLLKFAPATAQKNINLEILESVLIPIPPLAEMTRIVEKIEELVRLCDQLKFRITNASEKQKKLADALVEQAVEA